MTQLRSILALLSLALLGACNSSTSARANERSGTDGAATRVLLKQFEKGMRFELVSEAHTDPLEYYSTPRDDASLKIQTNEVMEALLEVMEDSGFARHAQPGSAPSRGNEYMNWCFEVERDGAKEHWAVGTRSELAELQRFGECRDAFLQLYNVTAAYQAVDNESGERIFNEAR